MGFPASEEVGCSTAHAIRKPQGRSGVCDLLHLRCPAPGPPGAANDPLAFDALDGERVLDPVRAGDRIRLRRERDADLVPPAERHLQRRGRADPALERNRGHLALRKERGDLGHVVGIAREVEVDARARDERAVDAAAVFCDSLHARGRDGVRLDVEAFEPGAEDLGRDLLRDRGRADAENDLALLRELAHRADVAKPCLLGAIRGRLAPPLARPQHLALQGRADKRAHLTGEEQSDGSHVAPSSQFAKSGKFNRVGRKRPGTPASLGRGHGEREEARRHQVAGALRLGRPTRADRELPRRAEEAAQAQDIRSRAEAWPAPAPSLKNPPRPRDWSGRPEARWSKRVSGLTQSNTWLLTNENFASPSPHWPSPRSPSLRPPAAR